MLNILTARSGAAVEQFLLDEEFMVFDAGGNFHLPDTLTALTVPGFTIPNRAIFEPEANAEAVRTLLQKTE